MSDIPNGSSISLSGLLACVPAFCNQQDPQIVEEQEEGQDWARADTLLRPDDVV